MVTYSSIATICKRARASVTDPSYVVRVSAENPSCQSTTRERERKIKKNQNPIEISHKICQIKKIINQTYNIWMWTHLAMKLQCLCRITCHMTSSCCIFYQTLAHYGEVLQVFFFFLFPKSILGFYSWGFWGFSQVELLLYSPPPKNHPLGFRTNSKAENEDELIYGLGLRMRAV